MALLKLGPGVGAAGSDDIPVEGIVGGLELIGQVAGVEHSHVLGGNAGALVEHFKHFVSPEELFLELLAVDVDDGGIHNLEAGAHRQKHCALGIFRALDEVIGVRHCVEVVYAVAVGVSRQRADHEFAVGDVAEGVFKLLDGSDEALVVAGPEQSEAVLDAVAVVAGRAAVGIYAPVVVADAEHAVVLCELVDEVVRAR